jgi:two-component system OmpR family sensor kinase
VSRLKLTAAVLGLAGAIAGIIALAGATELRSYLTQQADQQLSAAAGGLSRHAQVAWPGEGGPGRPYVEVFTPGGRPLMPLGRGAAPAVPASPAWVQAHAGRPVTVPGRTGGQSWRVIAEPVHYQAHHILYVYGASDYSLVLTSRAVPGRPATLVVGVGLADVSQAERKLVTAPLAFCMVIILAAAGIGAAASRGRLRPLRKIRSTIAGRAGEEMAHTQAAAESAALEAREQMRRALVAALQDLREPVSVVAGFAEYYRQGSGRDAGEPGAMMRRVADETARMSGTIDALDEAGYSRPCSSA